MACPGDGGGEDRPQPQRLKAPAWQDGEMSRSLFQSFFFTYLLPCGSRREGQRVGLGGSLHRAGGRTARRAEGRLDHFNGFGVAHLPQGLHQLFYCPPRDLRDTNEGGGGFCIQSCAGTNRQAVNMTARPFPEIVGGLGGCSQGREQLKDTRSLNQGSCFSSKTTQEITEKHFIVSRESAEAVKLYPE